VAEKRIDLIS